MISTRGIYNALIRGDQQHTVSPANPAFEKLKYATLQEYIQTFCSLRENQFHRNLLTTLYRLRENPMRGESSIDETVGTESV